MDLLGRIDHNLEAKDWTWLKVGGAPIFTFFPQNQEDLRSFCIHNKHEYRVFGAGSNILIRDGGFDGVFLRLGKAFRNYVIEKDGIIFDSAWPGINLVEIALENGLGGAAFLATIPGTLGGFIKMNAGAHGMETADVVDWVEFMDSNGVVHKKSMFECGFKYRHSNFLNSDIILRAKLKLEKVNNLQEAEKIQNLIAHRKKTQPVSGSMAGCFFKNHQKYPAWQLIRGYEKHMPPIFDTVAISEIHANFLLNKNNASAADMEHLIEHLQANIFFKTGVWLETEVERIGLPKIV